MVAIMNIANATENFSFKTDSEEAAGISARDRHTQDLWERTHKLEDSIRRHAVESTPGTSKRYFCRLGSLTDFDVLRHLSKALKGNITDVGSMLVGFKRSKHKIGTYRLTWTIAAIEYFALNGFEVRARKLTEALIGRVGDSGSGDDIDYEHVWQRLLEIQSYSKSFSNGFGIRDQLIRNITKSILTRVGVLMTSNKEATSSRVIGTLVTQSALLFITAVGRVAFDLLGTALKAHGISRQVRNTIMSVDYFALINRGCDLFIKTSGQGTDSVAMMKSCCKTHAELVCEVLPEESWPKISSSYIRVGLASQYKRKLIDSNLATLGYTSKSSLPELDPGISVFEQLFPGAK